MSTVTKSKRIILYYEKLSEHETACSMHLKTLNSGTSVLEVSKMPKTNGLLKTCHYSLN